MPRSNAPLALSVVSLTVPGDVPATLARMTAFDDRDFGFNHNQTWAALPKAICGEFDPDAVAKSFRKEPIRIQKCIVALCRLGKITRRNVKLFAHYPESGLNSVQSIDWGPDVRVRVKASCWYTVGDKVFIPVLQPRKDPFSPEQLAVYLRLVRQAYCQGDWVEAEIDLIDLSGQGDPIAKSIDIRSIPDVSDQQLASYVQTYTEAKRIANSQKSTHSKKSVDLPMSELLGID